MIPDEAYQQLVESLQKMRFNDYKSYKERLAAGTEYQIKSVKIGDVVEIPDWYYEEHKNDRVQIGLHIANYSDSQNRPHPFDMNDAIKHRYEIDDVKNTMKTVQKFVLVEEPILTHKKSVQSNQSARG